MKKGRKPTAKERELLASWEDLKARHSGPLFGNKYGGKVAVKKAPTPTPPQVLKASFVPHGGTAKPTPTYTGDQVLGVTIVHKSCLQPVFTQEQAVDAAHMRR